LLLVVSSGTGSHRLDDQLVEHGADAAAARLPGLSVAVSLTDFAEDGTSKVFSHGTTGRMKEVLIQYMMTMINGGDF
jgi:hypothetical protein